MVYFTKGQELLKEFRAQLKVCYKTGDCDIVEQDVIDFIEGCEYQHLYDAGRVFRSYFCHWATEHQADIKPWFIKLRERKPGFFEYPDRREIKKRSTDKRFVTDIECLAKLRIIDSPEKDSGKSCPEPSVNETSVDETHFPSICGHNCNSLPDCLVENRPDLKGKTREEVWLSDVKDFTNVHTELFSDLDNWVSEGIEFYKNDTEISRVVRLIFSETKEELQSLRAKYSHWMQRINGPLTCIDADRKRAEEAAKIPATPSIITVIPSFRNYRINKYRILETQANPTLAEENGDYERQESLSDVEIASVPKASPTKPHNLTVEMPPPHPRQNPGRSVRSTTATPISWRDAKLSDVEVGSASKASPTKPHTITVEMPPPPPRQNPGRSVRSTTATPTSWNGEMLSDDDIRAINDMTLPELERHAIFNRRTPPTKPGNIAVKMPPPPPQNPGLSDHSTTATPTRWRDAELSDVQIGSVPKASSTKPHNLTGEKPPPPWWDSGHSGGSTTPIPNRSDTKVPDTPLRKDNMQTNTKPSSKRKLPFTSDGFELDSDEEDISVVFARQSCREKNAAH